MYLLETVFMTYAEGEEDAIMQVVSQIEPDYEDIALREDNGVYYVSTAYEYVLTTINSGRYRVEVFKGGF